jgi:hypothetical protein
MTHMSRATTEVRPWAGRAPFSSGATISLTSVVNNGDGTYTWNFNAAVVYNGSDCPQCEIFDADSSAWVESLADDPPQTDGSITFTIPAGGSGGTMFRMLTSPTTAFTDAAAIIVPVSGATT